MMYTHVVTGYTLTLLLVVQKLKMYKLEMYKTGNVQPHCYRMYKKLEMYKIGDVQKLEMYNHSATEYTNYIEPDVQKKSLSKPINIRSSFQDLDASSSKVKTVHNLD